MKLSRFYVESNCTRLDNRKPIDTIVFQVRGKMLDPDARSLKLTKLSSNTRYLICVLGLGNWLARVEETNVVAQVNTSHDDIFESTTLPEMVDSATSRCTEVKTLVAPEAIIVNGDGAQIGDASGVTSILTRRLGLIVGCCMGFVVFIFLVSVLGYLKVKKQREAVKRDADGEQPIPPEYISYRHFSIQSGEAGNAARTANQEAQHPGSFIGNMGTTTLNV